MAIEREAFRMVAMTDIKAKAAEAAQWFESAMRPDGETSFIRAKQGTPEWVTELIHEAHGADFLPDDWRYKWTLGALEFIAESDDPEDGSGDFADQAVSVYTGERFAWLSSNLQRAGYVNEAATEYGYGPPVDVVAMVGLGQYMEAGEVYSLVLNALQS